MFNRIRQVTPICIPIYYVVSWFLIAPQTASRLIQPLSAQFTCVPSANTEKHTGHTICNTARKRPHLRTVCRECRQAKLANQTTLFSALTVIRSWLAAWPVYWRSWYDDWWCASMVTNRQMSPASASTVYMSLSSLLSLSLATSHRESTSTSTHPTTFFFFFFWLYHIGESGLLATRQRFFRFFWGIMVCWLWQLITRQWFHYSTLIGSLTMLVICNHWHAALMTVSAWTCLWLLLTLALDAATACIWVLC